MMHSMRKLAIAFAAAAVLGGAGIARAQAPGERFEVASIRAVRAHLVDTVAALRQGDVAKARAAFADYDSAWNGIEVYINTRSRPLYQAIELDLQKKIEDGLAKPNPDTAALLPQAQAILAKYDEAIDLVAKAAPLNPQFDEVARLRIVRAHLREVLPALKAGNLNKARSSFEAFDSTWDGIEDLVKARSNDAYVAIEKGMVEIEQALMPAMPDVAAVTGLVNDVLARYNGIVTQITQEARSAGK